LLWEVVMGTELRIRARHDLRVVVAAGLLLASAPARAEADMWCWLFGSGCGGGSGATTRQGSPDRVAPEIDPNALACAIALAAGGAALLGDRVRRRR
jgi:hypothetical protein